jgi:hypothetical protein
MIPGTLSPSGLYLHNSSCLAQGEMLESAESVVLVVFPRVECRVSSDSIAY